MTPTRYLLPLIAAACLLGLFFFCPDSPVWEARTTLRIQGEAAGTVPQLLESAFFSAHLREISDFDGSIQADPIPGTALVEVSLRDDSASHVQAGMEAFLSRLTPVMGYFSQDFSAEIVLQPRISQADSGRDLTAVFLAAAAVLLLLLPAPKCRGELDLFQLLRRLGIATRRFWPLVLGIALLVSTGYYVYRSASDTPSYQASALVSLGNYDAGTAPSLPATVQGLLKSDLMTQHLTAGCRIGAAPVAGSNLFTFTTTGPTRDAAQSTLDTLLDRWPELSAYTLTDLSLEVHQSAPAGNMPVNPWNPSTILFQGFLLGLLCWCCPAFTVILFRQNVDTKVPKAYNESQS